MYKDLVLLRIFQGEGEREKRRGGEGEQVIAGLID